MSCADVQTIQAGNGTKTQFSFDFPYLFKTEIEVSFWNATTKEWDVKATTDATYPWRVTDANPTIVEFTSTAPPSPTTPVDPNESSVDNVRIRRTTSIDDIRALFSPGSAIRSDDLNKNFEQLRYAIQEANCQGVTDEVYQYLLDNYWDRFDNTIYDGNTWVSDDTKIASTAAIDDRLDFVITNDIGTDGTGITVTDDGDGTITLGLAANSIDFDRIKDADIITQAEQDAGTSEADTNIFTALAAARRFDCLVQTSTPTGSTWETGKMWVQNDSDRTVHIWDSTQWLPIASGGAFTTLPKVVYVDSINGDDNYEAHRLSNPKKTIKSAIDDINADPDGDGSIVVVAPGIYGEEFPIDIEKNDVAIVGTSLRNCIIHPAIPAADQAGYDVDVPETNELQIMFRVNSGSYFYGLTLQGMKASGTRGGNALDTDATYGLPTNQGWNFAFYPNAVIKKSPYIQNCTNFSDSQINNVNFTPHVPGEGAAGDLDSGFAGGGILIDGSAPASNSPLRSMVCDSYTHTALNGPGIFVTNNGYCQATSSYSFFNHFHLKTKNGGQANLAASTTDFGSYSLIADGRSTNAIFTAATTAGASASDITFTIGAPSVGPDWHGSATRPQDNMLVDIGGNTYPVLSAVAAGSGWTVTISRPDPTNLSQNLGLQNNVASGASANFYLRSMIASSGHTMEYVGSGTDYRALPENGGVPIEARQKTELNNGKIWAAVTDHKGKFIVGDTFSVDQQTGFIETGSGSFAIPRLIVDLDLNGNNISDSTGNVVINDTLSMNSNKIVDVTDPTSAQDAATKAYVDALETSLEGGQLDNLYFRQDTGETIESGDTWSSSDASIATTAAIDARVIDLVDDVGGFVPINNENSFPATNPDINDGAGTLISIQEISTSRTPSGGTVTIANGSGSNTVTINNCGTTVLAAGYGCIVETTSTLHTYNFHRLTPLATEVSTVAANVTPINTVATNISDVTTVSTNLTDIQTVANDLNEPVSEIDTVATNIANVNTVGNSISDVNTVAGSISNVNSVGSDITNVNTVAGSISNVNTVAGSITDVNTFANRYRIASSDPTTSLDVGDLVFNTTSNELRVYNGTSWQGGVTATGNLVSKSGDTMTGDLSFGGTQKVTNLATPSATGDAATKGYVDTAVAAAPAGTSIVATGNLQSNIDTELSSLTTGDYNLAFGSTALASLTTGDHNIALGSGALDSLTTSSNNIGIGQNALTTITVGGIRNIGIGRDTGAITEGDDNVFIGDQTGGQLTANSSRNVLIGGQIKNSNAGNIDYLTIVGHQAGYNISFGHSNSIVGANAGYNLTSGTQNVLFGRNTGYNLTTGINSVIIGANAGSGTTTSSGTTAVGYNATGGQGTYNLMLGYESGSSNITGAYNIGVGYNANGSLTSGTFNTGIGYNATATTGHYNNLFGRNVSVGSGQFNVLIGDAIGNTSITGTDNIGMGRGKFASTTSGHNNICLGTNAGLALTTGYYNISLGYAALDASTTGNNNIALGFSALGAITTGTNNVGIGPYTGSSQTLGAYNVYVGYNAGRGNIERDYQICIGYNATGGTAFSSVVIGAEAGHISNQSGNNVFVGRYTGSTWSSGGGNAVFGHSASTYKSQGSKCTIIGSTAGIQGTADNITAIGYAASYSNSGGQNNTTVGYEAGYGTTSGYNNTMLGYRAGNATTTGTNNIVIGNDADATSSTTSNEITLGNTSITKFRIPGVDFVVEGSAWVNFDGTGTVTIRDSNNVSSITDNGTGDHTVNFTNAMPDTNYIAFGNVIEDTGGFKGDHNLYMYRRAPVTGSVRVNTCNLAGNVADEEHVFVGVIR